MAKDIELLSHKDSSVATPRPVVDGNGDAVGNSVHFDSDGVASGVPDDIADFILYHYSYARDVTV